ncbi:MAG TPA: anthrone oxygenase family protein [Candidatus Limnocylindria bacterium]|nr:anthrone oxygenase family protein [Candidatus Limnocylindria bacterium]
MNLADIAVVVATVLVGLLAGNELGTLSVVHPALEKAGYPAGRPGAQAIVARYGKVMPAAMPLTIAVTFLTAALLDGTQTVLMLIAGALLVVMLLVTLVGLAPLNSRQIAATESTPAEEWRGWRKRWLKLHTVRVVCDITALVLVATAALLR